MSGLLRSSMLGVICATLLSSTAAQATTLRSMSTEDLVQGSSAIAVTQVVDTQAIRRGGRITTLVTLEVLSPVKGLQTGQRIFVRVPGGAQGDWAQRVDGAPVMKTGDLNVVFLTQSGPSTWQVVGLEQGKLDIVRDPKAPEEWLVRRSFTAPRVEADQQGQLQPAQLPPVTEPLGPYLDRVHSLVEAHP